MRKITAKDVAHAARVSQAAVSRAFNPAASISAKKREIIVNCAREIGYEPPSMKSVTALGSETIAFVAAGLDNPFYPVAADHLSKALLERGKHMILHSVPPGHSVDDVIQHVIKYRSEAVIVASATLSSSAGAACRRLGMPVILFNRTQHDPNATAVVCDNYAGARLVARRFLAQGRQRIAYIGGVEDTSTHRERRRGFQEALRETGAEIFTETFGHFTYSGGRHAAQQLLTPPLKPDAIFVANDVMALATIDVARALGLSVPDQVAIIGFDDIPMAAWDSYNLTTVRQPVRRMIADALELIEMLHRGESVEGSVRVSPVHLVQRGSG